jgi:hypothetical protein
MLVGSAACGGAPERGDPGGPFAAIQRDEAALERGLAETERRPCADRAPLESACAASRSICDAATRTHDADAAERCERAARRCADARAAHDARCATEAP